MKFAYFQTDDDTFVIIENLRYFLSSHDPSDPVYFGHHFNKIVKQVSSCISCIYLKDK